MHYLQLIAFLCFLIYACIGIHVYRMDCKSKLNLVYMLLCCNFAVLALSSAFKPYVYSIFAINAWSIARNFSLCSFGGLMLHFTAILTGMDKGRIRRRFALYAAMYAPGALLFILKQTLKLAAFMNFAFVQNNMNNMTKVYDIVMILYHMIFSVICFLLIWLWGKRSVFAREKRQAAIIILSGSSSLFLSVAYLVFAGIFEELRLPNINYIFILLTALGVQIAIIKYKFMDPSSLITPEDILSNVTDMIMLISPDGRVIWANNRLRQVLKYNDDRMKKIMLTDILDTGSKDILDRIHDVELKEEQFPDRCFIAKNGERVPVDIILASILDICGDKVATVVIASDIRPIKRLQQEAAERREAERRIEYLSMYDSLTGLYNRARFEQEISALSNKPGGAAAVILCDLDGLKLANDTLGHKSGDELLIAAAEILKNFISEDRLVARIGGDEFVIILKKGSPELVKEIVTQINSKVAEYNSSGQQFPLNLSVGCSTFDIPQRSISDMFKEADDNMYREKLRRRYITRNSIARTLAKMLETRDYIIEGHGERLEKLVEGLGIKAGLSGQELEDLKLFAQFHDIGKVGIPEHILFKMGELTEQEKAEIRRHSEVGYRIAQSSQELMHISDWILMHHEWWNGEGYPIGIKGADIPLQSRILAICDAFDAMTHDRPYRKAISEDEALGELVKGSGTQFDPELVKAFIGIISKSA